LESLDPALLSLLQAFLLGGTLDRGFGLVESPRSHLAFEQLVEFGRRPPVRDGENMMLSEVAEALEACIFTYLEVSGIKNQDPMAKGAPSPA
jgi:hypothetical protein